MTQKPCGPTALETCKDNSFSFPSGWRGEWSTRHEGDGLVSRRPELPFGDKGLGSRGHLFQRWRLLEVGPHICAQHLGRAQGSSWQPCVCQRGNHQLLSHKGKPRLREGRVHSQTHAACGSKTESQTRSDSDWPPPPRVCFHVWGRRVGGAASGHVCGHISEGTPLWVPST